MTREPWSRQNYIGLKLFSGAPNPRWPIDEDAGALLGHLVTLPERPIDPGYLVPNAFYGGVVVHLVDERGHRRRFVINKGHIFDSASKVVRLDTGRQLERRLFEKIPVNLVQRIGPLLDVVPRLTFENLLTSERLSNEIHGIDGVQSGEVPPACRHAPQFEPPPSRWDEFPGIEDNNCYNYANDEFSSVDDAQPGRLPFFSATVKQMHKLLVRDRLKPVGLTRDRLPEECLIAPGAHLIAVCLRMQDGTTIENGVAVPVFKDYHCFRLDQAAGGARWSHKDGAGLTSFKDNRDASPLTDLAAGRFKLQQKLVGYYWSIAGVREIGLPVFT